MTDKIDLKKVVAELAQNNDSSIDELFNYYYPRLFNFSRSILKIEDGIDDILQEVFVKIWQNRRNIKSTDTFNAYIFTITRNLLLNELRRRINSNSLKEEIRKFSTAPEYSLNKTIEYREMQEKVDTVINELPGRQKEIFVLSRKNGLSHKEIAEKLGIKTKTVEYHISLAIKHIKSELSRFGILSLLYFYLFL